MLPAGGQLDPQTTSLSLNSGAGAGKLSRVIIFAIVVFGVLVSIVIFVILFKRSLRRKRSSLPPKQPLALHRERESKHLSLPSFPRIEFDQVNPHGSDASSSKLARTSSFRTIDSFAPPSSSSGHSHSIATRQNNFPGLSSQLFVDASSNEHASTAQHHAYMTRPARSVSLSRSRQLSRDVSTSSRSVSTRSVKIITGAPCSPYSNVRQIALPAPLAPQLQDRMVVNSSAVQTDGSLLEQGNIADRWMMAPTRTTSRRSNPDHNLLGDDTPRRKTSRISEQQDRRSSDDVDQLDQSESQTRPRGRTSSPHPIRRRLPGPRDPPLSTQSLDDQTRPPRANSQNPYYGQGIFASTSLRFIPTEPPQFSVMRFEQGTQFPGHAKARQRPHSRSIPRQHRHPSGISDPPPLNSHSAAHSWYFYSLPRDEQPPPPVPPLPRLPQDIHCK